MQTKKRAKPVKFGKEAKKAIKEDPISDKKLEEAKSKDVEENKIEDTTPENEPPIDDEAGKRVGGAYASRLDDEEKPETDKLPEENPILKAEEDQEKKLDQEEKDTGFDENVENDTLEMEDVEDDELVSSEEFFSKPPETYDRKSGFFKYFLSVALITFLLGLGIIIGGSYALSNRDSLLSFINPSTVTPTIATKVPTPTQLPLDLMEFGIRILNGTSVKGLAAELRDELEAEGFKVVSVGNAASDDFEKTQIEAVEKVDQRFLDKLQEELGKKYEIGDISLKSSSEAEIIITIGSASAR